MLTPLEQWCCDTCGDLIATPEDGCIEWRAAHRGRRSSRFIIAHLEPQCRQDHSGLLADDRFAFAMLLSEARTAEGLAALLNRLKSLVPRRQPEEISSLVEVILRVTLPHYEEARFFWDLAAAEDVHDGTRFDEATFVRIIRWKDIAVTAGIEALTGRELTLPAWMPAQS